MGRLKRGYNWKGRQKVDVDVDRSAEKKIKLDVDAIGVGETGFDDNNLLALPSKKRKTNKKEDKPKKTKQLTRKERRQLEKVIEKKEKKTNRKSILESLSSVQASQEELQLLTSISEVYSQRFKSDVQVETSVDGEVKLKTIKGINKKNKQKVPEPESDSSIDTSDMSSDEEEEEEDLKELTNQIEEQITESEKNRDEPMKEEKTSVKVKDEKVKVDDKPKVEEKPNRTVINVPVMRTAEVEANREKLPIFTEEQVVMETINDNPVTIICGETGSGKTTQVPQFLYEAGYAHGDGIIGITEPRRVAAISMSQRVAMEMNLSPDEISYQIRYEGNTSSKTKIKFMTDGVLLKEVQQDFMLSKYSVIIIDEAHERSVYTDILIGLLSRIVPLRNKRGKPLKMIIMSATLRVEDFTENKQLFKIPPPVLKVNSRQFPVTIHFNKRTPVDDYLSDCFKKVCKIHRMLPSGGILVFVTGQQEVRTLCYKLRKMFPYDPHQVLPNKKEERKKNKKKKREKKIQKKIEKIDLPKVDLNNYSIKPVDEEGEMDVLGEDSDLDILSEGESETEDMGKDPEESEETGCQTPLYVLPLYSLLPSHKQIRVFDEAPPGCRLCVVSTNVAETSLTIPNIKYVVDTGKVKTKFYDKVTGVSTFKVTWTSQASANQRAGRAGRVSPGHCYRLYSSAVFNDDFEMFSPPEICRRPVDDLLLQMKEMNIDKVQNFPYPTPPDIEQLKAAESLLLSLGALSTPDRPKHIKRRQDKELTKITPLGRGMAKFPVSPRYARILALGHQENLLPYVIAIVSALSVDELFIETPVPSEKTDGKQKQKTSQIRKLWAGGGQSLLLGDLMVLLKAVGACEYQGFTPEFCTKFGIRYKSMKEIRKLRAQLTNTVNIVIPDANLCVDPKLSPPTDVQCKMLRQIVLAGLADHVARRYPDPPPGASDDARKLKHAYQCTELEEPVFIHPSSILFVYFNSVLN
ncbi:probable ATP-dependent RNA helicase DHX37 [Patella vulgata]|uniref:probable ATP-dependent RNA helicase DHX37 n=1 Tax=Patella vulgata TaxID=6465 RepID=UPI00217F63EE|nr:probable ATP-dependent RNA helicase DHX37 [Patella vulgata]